MTGDEPARRDRARRVRPTLGAVVYVAVVLGYGWVVRAVVIGLFAGPTWLGTTLALVAVAVLLGQWRWR